jgi:exonuclease SbcD
MLMGYTDAMAIRFLQISDLHLGRPLISLPDDIAESLRQSVRDVFAQALATAAAEGVELVLLPGDLYEHDGIDPGAQLRFIYEHAARLAPVPVVIAPGNHDPFGTNSPYATEQAPSNVVLFTKGDLTAFETHVGLVAGRAAKADDNIGSLAWSALPRPPVGKASILVLHAAAGKGDDRHKRGKTVHASLENLADSGYSYTALGHYHNQRTWLREGLEKVFAAYAGCPQGLGWDELGPKGYVTGVINDEGAKVEFVPAAQHIWRRAVVDLPPDYLHDADARLLIALQEVYDTLDESDLLELAIRGRWPDAGRQKLTEKAQDVCQRAWFSASPDLSAVHFFPQLPERGDGKAVDQFLDACETGLSSENDDEQRAWELARYLGLRLLGGQGLPTEVA